MHDETIRRLNEIADGGPSGFAPREIINALRMAVLVIEQLSKAKAD